jgi:hypothetical protein
LTGRGRSAPLQTALTPHIIGVTWDEPRNTAEVDQREINTFIMGEYGRYGNVNRGLFQQLSISLMLMEMCLVVDIFTVSKHIQYLNGRARIENRIYYGSIISTQQHIRIVVSAKRLTVVPESHLASKREVGPHHHSVLWDRGPSTGEGWGTRQDRGG